MEALDWSSNLVENFSERSHDGFMDNSDVIERRELASSSSPVLDREKEKKKGVSSTERSVESLKNHSEAEKRRRARINGHLDTLRSVIPCAKKMDKASLLGEVIRNLKELKRNATKACEGLMIPKDSDEIRVEELEGGSNGFPYSIKASLCCEYKPGLLPELRQALDALHLKIIMAEIATLGGRMKNVFVIISCKEPNINEDAAYRQFLAVSVHQAIRSVLDRFSCSEEILGSRKRRRLSIFCSSQLEDFL